MMLWDADYSDKSRFCMNVVWFFHTVKYLKPVQVYGRLWFRLYRPKPDMALAPATRPVKGDWISPCKKPSSFCSPCTFKFLNVVHELKKRSDWNNSEWEKLWLETVCLIRLCTAWQSRHAIF